MPAHLNGLLVAEPESPVLVGCTTCVPWISPLRTLAASTRRDRPPTGFDASPSPTGESDSPDDGEQASDAEAAGMLKLKLATVSQRAPWRWTSLVRTPRTSMVPKVQLPGMVAGAHEPSEEPVHEPSGLELGFKLGLVVGAAVHLPEDLQDPRQHDEIGRGDQNDADNRVPAAPPAVS